MLLRELDEKDAFHMLEWMKDNNVNRYFRFDPQNVTIDTVLGFIRENRNNNGSYHFAIVDEKDEYLGTVSLKNVDSSALNAEYAIALRRCAQGIGAGFWATREILRFAFDDLKLERVYLNVLSENEHAISFYSRFGFICEGEFYKHVRVLDELKSLKWYRIMKDEFRSLKY